MICHSEITVSTLIIREVNKDFLFYRSLCLRVSTVCTIMQAQTVTWPNWGVFSDRVSVHSSFYWGITAHVCGGEGRLTYCVMFTPCNSILVSLGIAFSCFIFSWILQWLEGMLDVFNFGMGVIPKEMETLICWSKLQYTGQPARFI